MQDVVSMLMDRYRATFEDEGMPGWAWEGLPPPIPFVGRHYGTETAPRVLVYASAENLTWLDHDEAAAEWIRREDVRWDRHRAAWDGPYPGELNIAPFDNGGLACAAALLWHWEGGDAGALTSYQSLVERLAVGNLSKFTIKTARRNKDVRTREILRSLRYVRHDIEVLRPTLVLLAKPVGAEVCAPSAQWIERVGGVLVVHPTSTTAGTSSIAAVGWPIALEQPRQWLRTSTP